MLIRTITIPSTGIEREFNIDVKYSMRTNLFEAVLPPAVAELLNVRNVTCKSYDEIVEQLKANIDNYDHLRQGQYEPMILITLKENGYGSDPHKLALFYRFADSMIVNERRLFVAVTETNESDTEESKPSWQRHYDRAQYINSTEYLSNPGKRVQKGAIYLNQNETVLPDTPQNRAWVCYVLDTIANTNETLERLLQADNYPALEQLAKKVHQGRKARPALIDEKPAG